MFRAAVALLDHLGPLVLVLEDVHWADAGTHDFLAFLAAHQPRDVAVILTVRTEAGLLPIREAFARAPSGPARTISLAPLSLPEVEELAGGVLGAELPRTFAGPLYEKTGGIPFVVEEVLRTLLERLPAGEIPGRPRRAGRPGRAHRAAGRRAAAPVLARRPRAGDPGRRGRHRHDPRRSRAGRGQRPQPA
ncbi:hypothetical protein GCM10020220_000290 [Nonomuraea rubra]